MIRFNYVKTTISFFLTLCINRPIPNFKNVHYIRLKIGYVKFIVIMFSVFFFIYVIYYGIAFLMI